MPSRTLYLFPKTASFETDLVDRMDPNTPSYYTSTEEKWDFEGMVHAYSQTLKYNVEGLSNVFGQKSVIPVAQVTFSDMPLDESEYILLHTLFSVRDRAANNPASYVRMRI